MKLLDELKKMAALDQADKEFLKRTEKRMGHFLKEGIDLFFCFFFRLLSPVCRKSEGRGKENNKRKRSRGWNV
ncbi:MAG: hypothetical protein KHY81_01955 [Lachnospiraceae bacterium]|nr:hypothetical protein [Lachnospiraceae bacterium]